MAWALAVAGVLLPPATLAATMTPPNSSPMPDLVSGIWLLKGCLVLLGAAAVLVDQLFPPGESTQAAPRSSAFALAALVVAGLALRLPGLARGLWFDEIQTLLDYVAKPWGTLLTTFDSSNQHYAFSIAAHVTRSLLGDSTFALRLPAAVFGALSLWAAVAFGRRWLPAREAWWSAALLAVSYHHVWFSQNARGYTGLLLGTLMASALFLDLLRAERVSGKAVWSYALAMAFAMAFHVTALVVAASHGIAWLATLRRRRSGTGRWGPFVALLLAALVTVACYALVIPQLLHAVGVSGTSAADAEWRRPAWFVTEAISGLVHGIPAGIVLVPLAGAIVIAGLASAWRRDGFATFVMVAPLALMAIVLFASGRNLWPRFFFFGAAFVVQWAVHGGFVVLERLLPRRGALIGSTGLAGITMASVLLLPRAWAPKQDYPAAARWVAEHAAPDDVVIGTEMLDLPMNRWLQLGWPIAHDVAELRALEAPAGATWLLYTFPIRLEATAPELWARVQTDYEAANVIPATIGGGQIVITRKSAGR